jgi:hypothetical protein
MGESAVSNVPSIAFTTFGGTNGGDTSSSGGARITGTPSSSGALSTSLGVARGPAEDVENCDPIIGVSFAKQVAMDIDLSYLRNRSESSNLSGICQLVVPEVNAV